jgi:mRNA interferase RelE/StbE
MSYRVEYSPEAFADLEKLPKAICQQVAKKIVWLADHFGLIRSL